jgi:hypothetical protein
LLEEFFSTKLLSFHNHYDTDMARTKATLHQSPSLIGYAERDLPHNLARTATTLARQAELIRASHPHEVLMPTDWVSERVKATAKPKHQRDLKKA